MSSRSAKAELLLSLFFCAHARYFADLIILAGRAHRRFSSQSTEIRDLNSRLTAGAELAIGSL